VKLTVHIRARAVNHMQKVFSTFFVRANRELFWLLKAVDRSKRGNLCVWTSFATVFNKFLRRFQAPKKKSKSSKSFSCSHTNRNELLACSFMGAGSWRLILFPSHLLLDSPHDKGESYGCWFIIYNFRNYNIKVFCVK
jgi:hypothetical protein